METPVTTRFRLFRPVPGSAPTLSDHAHAVLSALEVGVPFVVVGVDAGCWADTTNTISKLIDALGRDGTRHAAGAEADVGVEAFIVRVGSGERLRDVVLLGSRHDNLPENDPETLDRIVHELADLTLTVERRSSSQEQW